MDERGPCGGRDRSQTRASAGQRGGRSECAGGGKASLNQGFSSMFSLGNLPRGKSSSSELRSCWPKLDLLHRGKLKWRVDFWSFFSKYAVSDHNLLRIRPDNPTGGLTQILGSSVSPGGAGHGSGRWEHRGPGSFLEEMGAVGISGRQTPLARLTSLCGILSNFPESRFPGLEVRMTAAGSHQVRGVGVGK